MPSKSYALERGGRERVAVSWEGSFKDITLTFDGAALGSFATAKELASPKAFPLPDGSRLELVMAKFGPFPELRISQDGEPLPGSSGDPQTQLDGAVTILLLVAGLNAVLGLIAAAFDIGFLRTMGVGWASVVTGVIYAGLAALVRRQSRAALAVAATLFVLDGIYGFVAAAEAKVSPPVGSLIARAFFLAPMLRGFGAITQLQKPRKRRPPRSLTSRPAATASPAALSPGTPVAAPAPPAPAAKTFTGEAEKRRLSLNEKTTTSVTSITGKKVESKGPAGVDAARKSLRFIAHKVEIGEASLRATLSDGRIREVAFSEVVRVVTRQLPPDPPWDGAFFVDVVPDGIATGDVTPVRVFATTVLNYAAIPGASGSSRLENTRKLTGFLREQCPRADIDDATAEFIRGPKVPQRFVNMTQFIEYDTTYG